MKSMKEIEVLKGYAETLRNLAAIAALTVRQDQQYKDVTAILAEELRSPMSHYTYTDKAGGFCPCCRSNDIRGEDWEDHGNNAIREIYCQDCGAVWEDNYKLVSFTVTTQPDPEKIYQLKPEESA